MKSSVSSHTDDGKNLAEKISRGDEKAFEELFFEYYYQLCSFAIKITRSGDLARDTVQEVFFRIWRNRREWEVRRSLKVYLYQAVRNEALNIMEKQKTQRQLADSLKERSSYVNQTVSEPGSGKQPQELIKNIWRLVAQMPERRRLVFELHRKHGLSYKEIAHVMDISSKTVENHMGHALQFIRDNITLNSFF